MDSLLAQIAGEARSASKSTRRAIIAKLFNLAISLEDANDTAHRVVFSNFEQPIARVSYDLRLFHLLAESDRPLTIKQLSEKTGAAPVLMGRLCRYLASKRYIHEADEDMFTANNVTHAMTTPGTEGMLCYIQEIDSAKALPQFLRKTKFQDINSNRHAPFQDAVQTELDAWTWVQQHPEQLRRLGMYMVEQFAGLPTWLDAYPYKQRASETQPEQVFFVDVGGGRGQQSLALRERLPESELPNRVVVEDLPGMVNLSPQSPGVELLAQDFFTPQAIRGAKLYYLRTILHDFPDEKCIVILKHLAAALAPDSFILIDEAVLPAKGVHWKATQMDMTMMLHLGGMERTISQWHHLAAQAGLKVNKVYPYLTEQGLSIVELVSPGGT